mmetsp:Transcript_28429/g.36908  ORF Transcript_28429/g.36908 Transcript_28429/m.36908 type:complete len:198 (-) Transcript_28429:419-1012(-)|eukprot:CAMPEP_0117877886 /NCGR_PEP_ID=MMETSP0950-20121206/14501_1 /TAXON_ID=44440 /ORGANISM="Chattonella subsalsa, Strain CCMP2191" /LENGTH=197 /DNA_ID=CAMNT_0005732047 /DNA_START=54 /DNA_END=647 /DNA_ORIENTATION=+
MEADKVNAAPIKWAQRQDSVYLTIDLRDVVDHEINLTSTHLEFSGVSDGKKYACNLEFFEEVETEGSVWNVLPRNVQMHILKKDKEAEEWWVRLLKDKHLEKNSVSIDWEKYIDEDDDEPDAGFDMSALDGGLGFGGGGGMGGMGGMGDMAGMMGGMGGMGGDSDDDEGIDSDDEDLPDLEDADENPPEEKKEETAT